ncbi:hypothetical protein NQ314_017782 [Rhamnusium bicolor]|uniref:C2H2-type domain-containing protein n=1 Tax=Rhamnusium bicolor TaxID=1586634 RepID=A0AAV8WSX9_9CUCU|nr:hypothetical protein NQ314_017782 [Rhamnusium bicolor]
MVILEDDRCHFICIDCLDKLNNWYDFNQQVVKSFKIGHWLIQQKLDRENQEKEYNIRQEMSYMNNTFEGDKDQTCTPNFLSNVITTYINETDIPSVDNTYQEHLDDVANSDLILSEVSENEFETNTKDIKDTINNINLEDFSQKQCEFKFSSEVTITDEKGYKQKHFECVKCGKQFKRVQTLNDHIKRHYNSRNFACSVCGKTFYKQFNVTEHMRIHTGERPFRCEFCSKTFTRALLLRNHIKKVCQCQYIYIFFFNELSLLIDFFGCNCNFYILGTYQ